METRCEKTDVQCDIVARLIFQEDKKFETSLLGHPEKSRWDRSELIQISQEGPISLVRGPYRYTTSGEARRTV